MNDDLNFELIEGINNIREYRNRKVSRKNKHNGMIVLHSSVAIFLAGIAAATIVTTSKKKAQRPSTSVTISTSDLLDNKNETYDITINESEFSYETKEPINVSNDETITATEPLSKPKDEASVLVNQEKDNLPQKEESKTAFLSYDDRSLKEKVLNAKHLYGSIIDKYAKMYGLDPNLVLAVATQERGIHSDVKDSGGATGLMQIQNSVWEGYTLKAYNYETNSWDSILINEAKIKDVNSNVQIGCMILQESMRYMKYNVLAGLQCYNMGYGSMMNLLKQYSSDCNKSVDEILKDQYDTGWINYRNTIKWGDRSYIENVLSWLGTDINVYVRNLDGDKIDINITNNAELEKVY